jgi:hypothetical protein
VIAVISNLEVIGFIAVCIVGYLTVYSVTAIGTALYDGVKVARQYYREHPDAIPPDKFLVRLGLWGVR